MPRKLWVAGWYDPNDGEWTHVTFARKRDADERSAREVNRLQHEGASFPVVEIEEYTPATLPWWAPRPVLSPGTLYHDQAKRTEP